MSLVCKGGQEGSCCTQNGNYTKTNWANTCEEYKGCEHFCPPQVINTFHSPYLDQVARGTHTDHLSAAKSMIKISFHKYQRLKMTYSRQIPTHARSYTDTYMGTEQKNVQQHLCKLSCSNTSLQNLNKIYYTTSFSHTHSQFTGLEAVTVS